MKALAEQKVLTERILHQELGSKNLHSTFPLDDINSLIEINNTISEENREDYVSFLIKYPNVILI